MKIVAHDEETITNNHNNTHDNEDSPLSFSNSIPQNRSCRLALNCIGQFKDSLLQEEYISYCMHQKSSVSYVFFTFLIIGWAISETVARARYSVKESHHLITTYVLISVLFTFLAIMCCLLLFFYSNHSHHRHSVQRPSVNGEITPIPPKQLNDGHALKVSYLQVGFLLSITMVFAIKIYGQIAFTACIVEDKELFHTIQSKLIPLIGTPNTTEIFRQELIPYFCPSASSVASTASLKIVFLMGLCPQILMALLHEPRLYLVLSCHALISCLMLFGTNVSMFSLLPLLSLFLGIGMLFVELHYQNAQSFVQYRMLDKLLRKKEENKEEANQATIMRQMIGNVAHDLKTPLASFVTGLDMIQDLLQSSKEKIRNQDQKYHPETFDQCIDLIQPCLSNIYNTNAFMLMTINRCIDYTKASQGMKLVPKYETVDLREALQFPIECMSNIQERIEIKLEPLSDEICSHIITDKQWLQENLLCLLSNAVKYSAEGEVSIKASMITSSCCSEYIGKARSSSTHKKTHHDSIDDVTDILEYPSHVKTGIQDPLPSFLLFEVEDHGIGVSEEKMADLFNPFNQAQRLAGGTGLGLFSLAKRVEALNGSYGMKRRNDQKQGLLFWFTIPYRADRVSAAPKVLTVEMTERISTQSSLTTACNSFFDGKLEILLVDDSPSIVKMSSMMLKRQSHQIWTAENGEIALKRIEEKWKESGRGFDLVLMDLQMPVMDGLEATRRLRKMESEGRDWMSLSSQRFPYSRHVIFGVSANSDDDTMMEASDAGVNDFLGKPFSIDIFNSAISNHLCSSPF